MIEPGTAAPDFALADQDGNEVSLAGLRGRTSVLVFYPLAFSPVCTDQLGAYQQAVSELEALGVDLYGVSVDSAFAQRAFRERLGLTFPLLADFEPKGALARRLGVYDETRGVARRALVMIDREGVVRWAHLSPSPLEIPGPSLILDAVSAAA